MKKYLTKRNIIIAVIALVIINVVVGAILIVNDKKDNKTKSIFDKQVVEGLSFTNGSITNDSGLYTYTVTVKNTNKKDKKLKYVVLKFYDNKNKKMASLVGYIGDEIKKGKTATITANTDIDIRDAKKVEITIEK